MLGGFIVQKWGYGPAFLVTAILQIVAAMILSLILKIVAHEREVTKDEKEGLLAAADLQREREGIVGDQHSVTGSVVSAYASVVESIAGHLSHNSGPCEYGLLVSAGPVGSLPEDE